MTRVSEILQGGGVRSVRRSYIKREKLSLYIHLALKLLRTLLRNFFGRLPKKFASEAPLNRFGKKLKTVGEGAPRAPR